MLETWQCSEEDAQRLGHLRQQKKGDLIIEALRVIEPRLQSLEVNTTTGSPMIWRDVGLMQNLCGLAADIIREKDLMAIYHGALMEQFVGQELIACQDCFTRPALYYWAREARNSSAEIDYVCQSGTDLVPIEVKAGKTGRPKSLHQYLQEKRQGWGIKISATPLQYQKPVVSILFYMVNHWQTLWEARENENGG